MRKRLLSLLLSLALCLTLLPGAAWAAEDGPAEPLAQVSVSFPAPKAGEKVGDGLKTVSADADSGLTPYLFGPVLWQQDGDHQKLNADSVYEEGSVYWLKFTFYTQKPITAETAVTFNGQPVTLYADYAALETALGAYDGQQDAYLGCVLFSAEGTGDPSMGDLKDLYLLSLYAFIRVPKTLTVEEVSTEKELADALSGTKDVVKLTADIALSGGLTVNRTVTLDLNDHVLTLAGGDQFFAVSGKDVNMTLTDSAETKTERKFRIDQGGAWVPDENGDQTVSGGVITGGKAGIDDYGALAVNGGVGIQQRGTLTVTGGTVNAPVLNRRGAIAGSGTFNGTVVNEDRITGGTFNGPVANYKGYMQGDNEISGGIFYGTVANGYTYYNEKGEETGIDGKNSGLITGGTFYGKVTNAFYSKITGGSFYGEVDNREINSNYRGTLAGGTFYAGHPGTVADGCCTVTYTYPTYNDTYAIQIVRKGETAIRPAAPERSDFTFGGWYTYDETVYDFTADVTEDLNLYGLSTDTFYGIRITDKDGEVFYVTSKNYRNVLGDGTVIYTPGYIEEGKSLDDFTAEDLNKMLRGETVEGIRLPKLTLNGASFQQLAVGLWGDDSMTRQLNLFLQLELMGDNTIAYDETHPDEGAVESLNVRALFITGNGKLNVTAPAENGAGLSGDWSLYRQESGTVTIQAGDCGIRYDIWSSFNLTFRGGKLTIEAGNDPKDPYSGVINHWGDHLSCDISKSAAFLLGDSAENCISLTAPYTIDSILQELKDARNEGTLAHAPFYLSLTANYTVTFDTDGGSAVDTQTVAYGEKAEAPADPAKPGYTFAGWYLGEEKFDFEETPVRSDLTLSAHWTADGVPVSYGTLTFETNGGSAVPAQTLPLGSTVDLTKYTPAREGFTFTGWYADRGLTERVGTLTLRASATVYAGWNPFRDVTEESSFYEEILSVYNRGLMQGKRADTFAPGAEISRGQLAAVLWRLAGSPVVNYAMPYTDVTEDSWCAEAIRWAAAQGVVTGYADGSFRPDEAITRQQLAAFLYRYEQLRGGGFTGMWYFPLNFPDAGLVAPYADEAMHWCVMRGILQGSADGRLDPAGTATRAQAAAMLRRFLEE